MVQWVVSWDRQMFNEKKKTIDVQYNLVSESKLCIFYYRENWWNFCSKIYRFYLDYLFFSIVIGQKICRFEKKYQIEKIIYRYYVNRCLLYVLACLSTWILVSYILFVRDVLILWMYCIKVNVFNSDFVDGHVMIRVHAINLFHMCRYEVDLKVEKCMKQFCKKDIWNLKCLKICFFCLRNLKTYTFDIKSRMYKYVPQFWINHLWRIMWSH